MEKYEHVLPTLAEAMQIMREHIGHGCAVTSCNIDQEDPMCPCHVIAGIDPNGKHFEACIWQARQNGETWNYCEW